MPIIRASYLNTAMQCPSAIRPVENLREDTAGPAAALGTAVHRAIQVYLESDDEVEVEGGDLLIAAFKKAWQSEVCWESRPRVLSKFFRRLKCEVDLEFAGKGWTLTGHPDIVDLGRCVVDIKTGRRTDIDCSPQVAAYGLLAKCKHAAILWLRAPAEQRFEVVMVPETGTMIAALNTLVAKAEVGVHNPGPACTYCLRWHECEEARRNTQHQMSALMKPESVGQMEEAEMFARFTEFLPLMEKRIKELKEARLAYIRQGGRIQLRDGRELVAKEVMERKVHPALAFDATLTHVGDAGIKECYRFSVSKAEDMIRAKARDEKRVLKEELKAVVQETKDGAPKGEKTKAAKAAKETFQASARWLESANALKTYQAALDDAGAVSRVPKTRLTLVRPEIAEGE